MLKLFIGFTSPKVEFESIIRVFLFFSVIICQKNIFFALHEGHLRYTFLKYTYLYFSLSILLLEFLLAYFSQLINIPNVFFDVCTFFWWLCSIKGNNFPGLIMIYFYMFVITVGHLILIQIKILWSTVYLKGPAMTFERSEILTSIS